MTKKAWIAVAACAAMAAKPRSQSRNQMKLPSFRGVVEVRASIPGRMRLYIPAIADQPQQAELMVRQLESTGAVREAALNLRTATALIRYDETQVEAAVVEGAVIKLMGLDAQLERRPVSRMEEGLRALCAVINHGVLEATNGLLDARMLAGSVLTAAGVRSLIVSGAGLPGAMTLLWWASGIFGRNGHGQA